MKTNLFYQKLALTNIKNNSKTYVPYIITCIGTILMFYNMVALTYNSATGDGALGSIMFIGTCVTGIFSTIFIFYTNSFLVKRRKKEFGLYNVLGMEKKHIGKVMLWENTIIGIISLLVGLVFGVAFSKLITLILYKLLQFEPKYGFEISPPAIVATIVLFVVIFTLTLLSSLCQVYRAKPIELLKGGAVGEKEPKSNWFIALLGVLSLGSGYYIALTVQNPVSALTLFFVAVILVIIGTYCLFTAGSVVLLKLLKKKKSYYYKTKHFVSLSSMIYRMKKNAVGLSNICIMSTAVLVMISTTVSMYVGMNDLLDHRYPEDVLISTRYSPETRPDCDQLEADVKAILERDGVGYSNFSGYESLNFAAVREGNTYTVTKPNADTAFDKLSILIFITDDYFSRFSDETYQLAEDEVVLVSNRDVDDITITDRHFKVREVLNETPIGEFRTWLTDVVYVVVPSSTIIDEMYEEQLRIYDGEASSIYYEVSFDFDISDEEVLAYCQNNFTNDISMLEQHASFAIRQLSVAEFYVLYGGLFFLGIFLGFLFLLATVLIIYYKQVVEGFEDKERFRIMQNIGMSKAEVKKSINAQILTVFALPIVAAIIHIAFAFPILTKLLAMLNLTNVPLFAICTIITVIIFAIFYGVVYFATSKVYYKIVNQK